MVIKNHGCINQTFYEKTERVGFDIIFNKCPRKREDKVEKEGRKKRKNAYKQFHIKRSGNRGYACCIYYTNF